mmetsp:Transcript_27439/g.47630  ORF Transcript_27439/g.47630 Transcript_27439/m.47630 type:complete len:256 (+) Transcript_27439:27-794(+)
MHSSELFPRPLLRMDLCKLPSSYRHRRRRHRRHRQCLRTGRARCRDLSQHCRRPCDGGTGSAAPPLPLRALAPATDCTVSVLSAISRQPEQPRCGNALWLSALRRLQHWRVRQPPRRNGDGACTQRVVAHHDRDAVATQLVLSSLGPSRVAYPPALLGRRATHFEDPPKSHCWSTVRPQAAPSGNVCAKALPQAQRRAAVLRCKVRPWHATRYVPRLHLLMLAPRWPRLEPIRRAHSHMLASRNRASNSTPGTHG